jgi:hypothetical protein
MLKNPDSTDRANVPEKSAELVQSASFVQATTCVELGDWVKAGLVTVILANPSLAEFALVVKLAVTSKGTASPTLPPTTTKSSEAVVYHSCHRYALGARGRGRHCGLGKSW